ncbi:hypothetical protein CTI12_AA034700 [Artemisia annua]|uniref:Uncharacterized protein n=1 Tax=Artemisia annua TaxID=35608 RepID=A0A2U1PU89_ARTAN|nr:hypothetical protein CTI12_AA034700 [Artemisia annua]
MTTSSMKNKQYRGKGIEQLVRLRCLQERWNKMTEMAPPPPFNTFAPPQLNGAFQFRQPPVNYFNGVAPHRNMTNNELSSSQNNSYFKCVSDGCGACYKNLMDLVQRSDIPINI